MKNTILVFTIIAGFISHASAETLEAKPVAALLQHIESSRFTYRGNGLAFGFNSINSCIYTSDDMVVLKNYCVPKKNYPAKGYTIYSPRFGIIDIYQERVAGLGTKRDVRISVFPEPLQAAMIEAPSSYRIDGLNRISEYFYYLRGPACWATNYSRYTEAPENVCNVDTAVVSDYAAWHTEVERLTASSTQWNRLIRHLDRAFPR